MKKRLNVISLLFLLLIFFYCGKEGKQQIEQQGSSAHTALAEIDSLMWRQPDSALACLIPYFDTCCRDAKFCVSDGLMA